MLPNLAMSLSLHGSAHRFAAAQAKYPVVPPPSHGSSSTVRRIFAETGLIHFNGLADFCANLVRFCGATFLCQFGFHSYLLPNLINVRCLAKGRRHVLPH